MAQVPAADRALLLARAERAGWWIETGILATLLTVMILLAAGQILLRNLFGTGLPWADEGLRLLVLWTALFGAVAASREDRHIRIDVLGRLMNPRLRAGVALVLDLFTSLVSAVLAWYSLDFVLDTHRFADTVLGGLPAWAFQAVLPLCFALISWRYLVWAARRLVSLRGGGGLAR